MPYCRKSTDGRDSYKQSQSYEESRIQQLEAENARLHEENSRLNDERNDFKMKIEQMKTRHTVCGRGHWVPFGQNKSTHSHAH